MSSRPQLAQSYDPSSSLLSHMVRQEREEGLEGAIELLEESFEDGGTPKPSAPSASAHYLPRFLSVKAGILSLFERGDARGRGVLLESLAITNVLSLRSIVARGGGGGCGESACARDALAPESASPEFVIKLMRPNANGPAVAFVTPTVVVWRVRVATSSVASNWLFSLLRAITVSLQQQSKKNGGSGGSHHNNNSSSRDETPSPPLETNGRCAMTSRTPSSHLMQQQRRGTLQPPPLSAAGAGAGAGAAQQRSAVGALPPFPGPGSSSFHDVSSFLSSGRMGMRGVVASSHPPHHHPPYPRTDGTLPLRIDEAVGEGDDDGGGGGGACTSDSRDSPSPASPHAQHGAAARAFTFTRPPLPPRTPSIAISIASSSRIQPSSSASSVAGGGEDDAEGGDSSRGGGGARLSSSYFGGDSSSDEEEAGQVEGRGGREGAVLQESLAHGGSVGGGTWSQNGGGGGGVGRSNTASYSSWCDDDGSSCVFDGSSSPLVGPRGTAGVAPSNPPPVAAPPVDVLAASVKVASVVEPPTPPVASAAAVSAGGPLRYVPPHLRRVGSSLNSLDAAAEGSNGSRTTPATPPATPMSIAVASPGLYPPSPLPSAATIPPIIPAASARPPNLSATSVWAGGGHGPYGVWSTQGVRSNMEDAHVAVLDIAAAVAASDAADVAWCLVRDEQERAATAATTTAAAMAVAVLSGEHGRTLIKGRSHATADGEDGGWSEGVYAAGGKIPQLPAVLAHLLREGTHFGGPAATPSTPAPAFPTQPPTSFYAVFDGHGGKLAAEFCAAAVPRHLSRHPGFVAPAPSPPSSAPSTSWEEDASSDSIAGLMSALRDSFLATDVEFLRSAEAAGASSSSGYGDALQWHSGTTALAAVVRGRDVVIASLGDCRAVLGTPSSDSSVMGHGSHSSGSRSSVGGGGGGGGEGVGAPSSNDSFTRCDCAFSARALNREHTPSSEVERLEAAGGWVQVEAEFSIASLQHIDSSHPFVSSRLAKDGSSRLMRCTSVSRLNGELAVSRAIGDADYKGARMASYPWAWPRHILQAKRVFTADLVLSEPAISHTRVPLSDVTCDTPSCRRCRAFIILACDGLWEVLSSQEAVDLVAASLRGHDGVGTGDGEHAHAVREAQLMHEESCGGGVGSGGLGGGLHRSSSFASVSAASVSAATQPQICDDTPAARAARMLVDVAVRLGTSDNVTCVVVEL